jgi:GT2 family glycosyltransferase
MIDLSVVIVNYNVAYFLEQCLHSVFKAEGNLNLEVFVVDNDSVDDSVEMVRAKFPRVKLIANKKNVGFSTANNQAIKQANGRYVLLLNPDTLVEEDTFVKSVQFMDEHTDAGGLGVKMIDGQGRFLAESKRGLPTPAVAFYKIFGLSALFPKSKIFGQYHLGYLSKDETHSVPVLSGAFMLMRKECLDKVGLLDESFFMYGEDIDLSYRITQGGYKNYYFPKTRIIHYKGESTKKSSVNYVIVFYRAMLIFARKHFSKRHAKVYSYLINIAVYLRAAIALIMRLIRKAAVPVLEAGLIFGALILLKEAYQDYSGILYQNKVVYLAFLFYTLSWMYSVYLSGGYDRNARLLKIWRGVAFGSIFILAVYALLPETLRFSRALILLGTASTLIIYSLTRLVLSVLGFKRYKIGKGQSSQIGIIGSDEEFERIRKLVEESSMVKNNFFHIPMREGNNEFSQQLNRFKEVLKVYGLNTVIFSGQDLSSQEIISLMADVTTPAVDFKIAPPESLYIIGSNTIDKGGELFIMDINAINRPQNKRKKRVFDFLASIGLILTLPLNIWFVSNKGGYIKNCFKVLFGSKTWVAYSGNSSDQKGLPRLKPGVLGPLDRLKRIKNPQQTASRLNTIYARDYSLRNDLSILFYGLQKLGRQK